MANNQEQTRWDRFVEWFENNVLGIALLSTVAIATLFVTIVLPISKWLSKNSPTIKVEQPRVTEEGATRPRSKHVRVPITALHGTVEGIEVVVESISTGMPSLSGRQLLFFARTYKYHEHPQPGEDSLSSEDKLQHLRRFHFRYASPIDIATGEYESVNVLVKVEGWDDANFLGNDLLDQLPQADSYTFTLRITAKNANPVKTSLTVFQANSYADIYVNPGPQ